jgi:hypothetical protein
MSTIQQREIRTAGLPPGPLSKPFLTIGFALCAVLVRRISSLRIDEDPLSRF